MPAPAPPRARPAAGAPASSAVLRAADRWRWALAGLVTAAFLALCNGRWRPDGDGAIDLVVGRNLARGLGFTHTDGREEGLSPGLPRVAAAGFRAFGTDSVTLPLLAVAACYFLSLGCVFLWLRRLAGRPTAVLLTAVLGLSEAWLSYGVAVRTDLPFAAGVAAVLLGVSLLASGGGDRRAGVAGVAAVAGGLALAAASRSVAVVVVVALAATVCGEALRRRRFGLFLAGGAAAVAVGAAAAIALPAVRADAFILWRRLTERPGPRLAEALGENLPMLLSESLPETLFALDVGPFATTAVSLLLLAAFACTLADRTTPPAVRAFHGWLVGLFVVQWLLFLVHDRYVLPLLPLLVFSGWAGLVRVEAALLRWGATTSTGAAAARAPGGWVVPAAVAVTVAANAVALAEVYREQRSGEPLAVFADGAFAPLAATAARLRRETPADATLVARNASAAQLAWWADRRTLSGAQLERPGRPLPNELLAVGPLGDRETRELDRMGFAPGGEASAGVRRWSRFGPPSEPAP